MSKVVVIPSCGCPAHVLGRYLAEAGQPVDVSTVEAAHHYYCSTHRGPLPEGLPAAVSVETGQTWLSLTASLYEPPEGHDEGSPV